MASDQSIHDLLDEAKAHVTMYSDAIARFSRSRDMGNPATGKKEEKESDYLERVARGELLRTRVLPRFEAMVTLFESLLSGKSDVITYV